ncbi:hypothetical protein [Candidatus Enterococcus huntleyi]|uniref:hypothetical protein n=1 Tax=Candidatus Enterococcus huntleyi TaxID=1857217 RepID=UPI001F208218|nr:hypothetical protein [Enterococcus sp. JM4C]
MAMHATQSDISESAPEISATTNQTLSKEDVPEDVFEIIQTIETTVPSESIQTIQIYTPNESNHNKIYIIEAIFSDEQVSYFIYIDNAEKLVSIEENEYQGKRRGIIKQNNSDIPYFEANNLSK